MYLHQQSCYKRLHVQLLSAEQYCRKRVIKDNMGVFLQAKMVWAHSTAYYTYTLNRL